MHGAETFETLCSRITSCYARVRRRCTGKCNCIVFIVPSGIPDARGARYAKVDGISSLFRGRAFRERIDERTLPRIY